MAKKFTATVLPPPDDSSKSPRRYGYDKDGTFSELSYEPKPDWQPALEGVKQFGHFVDDDSNVVRQAATALNTAAKARLAAERVDANVASVTASAVHLGSQAGEFLDEQFHPERFMPHDEVVGTKNDVAERLRSSATVAQNRADELMANADKLAKLAAGLSERSQKADANAMDAQELAEITAIRATAEFPLHERLRREQEAWDAKCLELIERKVIARKEASSEQKPYLTAGGIFLRIGDVYIPTSRDRLRSGISVAAQDALTRILDGSPIEAEATFGLFDEVNPEAISAAAAASGDERFSDNPHYHREPVSASSIVEQVRNGILDHSNDDVPIWEQDRRRQEQEQDGIPSTLRIDSEPASPPPTPEWFADKIDSLARDNETLRGAIDSMSRLRVEEEARHKQDIRQLQDALSEAQPRVGVPWRTSAETTVCYSCGTMCQSKEDCQKEREWLNDTAREGMKPKIDLPSGFDSVDELQEFSQKFTHELSNRTHLAASELLDDADAFASYMLMKRYKAAYDEYVSQYISGVNSRLTEIREWEEV